MYTSTRGNMAFVSFLVARWCLCFRRFSLGWVEKSKRPFGSLSRTIDRDRAEGLRLHVAFAGKRRAMGREVRLRERYRYF